MPSNAGCEYFTILLQLDHHGENMGNIIHQSVHSGNTIFSMTAWDVSPFTKSSRSPPAMCFGMSRAGVNQMPMQWKQLEILQIWRSDNPRYQKSPSEDRQLVPANSSSSKCLENTYIAPKLADITTSARTLVHQFALQVLDRETPYKFYNHERTAYQTLFNAYVPGSLTDLADRVPEYYLLLE